MWFDSKVKGNQSNFSDRLKAIDVLCMKSLVDKVNIIPVIGKADAISKSELKTFKVRKIKFFIAVMV